MNIDSRPSPRWRRRLWFGASVAACAIAIPSFAGCVVRRHRPHTVTVIERPVQVNEIIIRRAPPPPRHEVVVVRTRPGPHHVWVAGYWEWRGDRHVWVAGRWVLPPAGMHTWVAPRWERRGGGYVFVVGSWR